MNYAQSEQQKEQAAHKNNRPQIKISSTTNFHNEVGVLLDLWLGRGFDYSTLLNYVNTTGNGLIYSCVFVPICMQL